MSFSSGIDNLIKDVDKLEKKLGGDNAIQDPPTTGFIVPPTPGADGNGLPYTKIPSNKANLTVKRNIITWFVPEFGTVNM